MSFHAWPIKIDLGILGEVDGIVEGEIIGPDECMTTKILKVRIFNGKGWLDITKRISKREMDRLSADFEDEFRHAHLAKDEDFAYELWRDLRAEGEF